MEFIANKPEEVPKLFEKAWAKRDPDALASIFVEDADFINVTGLYWNNRADIREAHSFGFNFIFKDSTLILLYTKVRQPAPNVAIVHAKFELFDQTDKEGGTVSHKRHTRFVFVVEKRDDRWVCLSAQNSEVLENVQTFLRNEDGSYQAVRYGVSKVDYEKYKDL